MENTRKNQAAIGCGQAFRPFVQLRRRGQDYETDFLECKRASGLHG